MCATLSEAIRRDIHVYNEATGFSLTSAEAAAGIAEDDWEAGSGLAKEHRAMLIELYSDNSIDLRVIVGDELLDVEQCECVASVSSLLHVPDGKLVVAGGFDWRSFHSWNEEGCKDDQSEGVRLIEIPSGSYLATVHTLASSVNFMHPYTEDDDNEPLGAWYRQSYPDEPLPAWLIELCEEEPEQDPGHEELYEDVGSSLKQGKLALLPGRGAFLDFILHLQPAAGQQGDVPKAPSGWFKATEGRCSLAKCPKGLRSETLRSKNDPAETW